jgi:O-antigen/teichoic acid export membrane protein
MTENHQGSTGANQERFRLFRDTLLNHTGLIVPGLANLIALPWLIRFAGRDAYGLWVAIASISMTVNAIDLGLSQATMRTVAESNDTGVLGEESRRFVQSAFLMCAVMGAIAAAIVGCSIPKLASSLHLDLGTSLMPVAAFAASAVMAQRIADFAGQILQGAGRFGILNALVGTFSISRVVGGLVVLKAGYGLAGLAEWHAVSATLHALIALTIASSGRLRLWRWKLQFDWASVRRRAQFALGSQMALLLYSATIDSAPILILGWLRGSSAIVTYHLGQRIALMAFQAFSSGSSVVFTMACEAASDRGRMVNVVRAGVRWMAILAVPTCAVLFVLAPSIVTAWLKSSDPRVVTILRISTGSMLVVALGDSALHAIWVSSTAALMRLYGLLAVPSAALCWALVSVSGATGAAIAVLITLIVFTVAVSLLAGRRYDIKMRDLAGEAFRGLAIPAAAACVIAAVAMRMLPPAGWPAIMAIALVSMAVFACLFLVFGAQSEERELLRSRFAHPEAR